jgi:hypothetical protein
MGGRDHMVVGFTTICATSAYHHLRCEFEPRSWFRQHKSGNLFLIELMYIVF